MEADWSVEIGPDLPWIDDAWPGFLDLRTSPHAIATLPEPAQHPALRDALLALNSSSSHLYTSKCDTWSITTDEIDPDEFSATPQNALAGFASYLDVIDRDPTRFSSFALTELRVRELITRLRQIDLNCARIDAVVRRAAAKTSSPAKNAGYGITLYIAACGADQAAAYASWQNALTAAVAAVAATIAVAASSAGE